MPDSVPPEPVLIAPMAAGDLAEALALQDLIYRPALREGRSVFAARLALCDSCCLVARAGGAMVGYLIAHGWAKGSPPALHWVDAPPSAIEVLYIHDLAIAPAGRGRQIGQRMVNRAFAAARSNGWEEAELVAVDGAHTYWQGLGFVHDEAPEITRKIAPYGTQARWMRRTLEPLPGEDGAA